VSPRPLFSFLACKMSTSFGFVIGDFLTVGTLALQIYKSTKGHIHIEFLSLRAVLEEVEEKICISLFHSQSPTRLISVAEGSKGTLADLHELFT